MSGVAAQARVRRRAGLTSLLPDGTPCVGEIGVLATDDAADRVQCHLCGRWLRALAGSHLSTRHGWTAER